MNQVLSRYQWQIGAIAVAVSLVVGAVSLRAEDDNDRRDRTCAGAGGAVYALHQVAASDSANFMDATNDVAVIMGKPSTIPTMAVATTNNTDCGKKLSGGTYVTDTNFPTSSTYNGLFGIYLSTNNSKEGRIPNSMFFRDTTPNPGTKYSTVEDNSGGATCTITDSGSTYYFYKTCLLP